MNASQETTALLQSAREVLDDNWKDGFTVPAPNQYPYQWSWDSAFIAAHPEVFRFVRKLPPGADATSIGMPVSLYVASKLSFCGRDFHDVAVVAVDMSRSKALVPDFPDLTLGANLMVGDSWSFDFADRRWAYGHGS